jgi:adenylate kinase
MLEVLAEQQKKSVLLLNIRVDEGMLMKRITGRLTCASCGEIYNTYCFPPKVEGICDIDGGELLRRGDDRPEAVTLRMAAYRAKTEPLIDYYNQSSRLIDVDGGQPVDQVFMKICQALEGQQVSDGS